MTARILIVDDVPANTRLLEAKLAAEYYQVASARDGFEALATARDWQPDLILLDVMMPGMDGYECCRQLKDDAATLHIPVVMVTALGEPGGAAARAGGRRRRFPDQTRRLRHTDGACPQPGSAETSARRMARPRRNCPGARPDTDRVLMPSIAGARVLVVDDWDQSAQSIQDALAEDGVMTGYANGWPEAIAMAAAVKFDLMVVSLALADEDPL